MLFVRKVRAGEALAASGTSAQKPGIAAVAAIL